MKTSVEDNKSPVDRKTRAGWTEERSVGIVFLGTVIAATTVCAGWNPETKTYDTTGYISMKAGVSESGSTASFEAGTNWEDGKAPEKGKSYYVPANSSLRMLSSCKTPFKGAVLATAGASTWQGATASIPVYHLLSGASFTFYNGLETFTNGVWTLYPTDPAKVVNLSWGQNSGSESASMGVKFKDMTIKGGVETELDFENASKFAWGGLYLTAPIDFSEFYGTLKFKVKTPATQYTKFTPAKGVPFDIPGTFSMCANSIIDASDATDIAAASLTVGNLSVETNVTLNVAASLEAETVRTLTVTGDYAHVGPLTISMPTSVDLATLADTVPARTLVPFRQKVPDDAGTDPLFACDDFRLVGVEETYGLPTLAWSVERKDGYDALCCSSKPIILKVSDGDSGSFSSLTNKDSWSDHELPHDKADYLVFNEFRVPACENPEGDDKYLWPFPGDSLVIGSKQGGKNGCLAMTSPAKGLSVGKLVLAENTTVVTYSSLGHVIAPKIETYRSISTTHNKYVTLRVYSKSSIILDGEISGETGFFCQYRGKNFPSGWIALPGANTNFTGKILMACQSYNSSTPNENYTPRETNRVEVVVADGRNLGGALPEFAYDALRIRDWALLDVTNTTEFAAANRGVFVDWMGCIGVKEGCVATFRNPFTFGGRLQKQGAGTLAFGGSAAKFAVGSTDNYTLVDDPVAATNELYVKEGCIMAKAADALNGVAITFAKGTGLKVDYASTDDVKTYGLRDTKWATPVAFDPDVDTVPVTLENLPAELTEEKTLGILTVPADQADAIRSKLVFSRNGRKGFAGKIGKTVDGTSATITLSVAPTGMLLLIR